jgi:hypothetical protein
MHRYKVWNFPMPTTAVTGDTITGTTIKTILQLATPSTRQIQLISWGMSLDDPPGADGVFELVDTDVAATVTAHVASGILKLDPNAPSSLMTLGTAATGYTASAEGSITNVRVIDAIASGFATAEAPYMYYCQPMPDERPIINSSRFLRWRCITPSTGVNVKSWICWDE